MPDNARDDVLKQALEWARQGHGVALAVVVSTWGSSPRPVGSKMAINDTGAFVGSVSGGCIESFVVSEAIDVIADGGHQDLTYGVTDEQAEAVHLTCGGNIRIFIERAPPLAELERMAGDQPVTRAVDLATGEDLMIDGVNASGRLLLSDDTLGEVQCLHKQGAGGIIVHESDAEVFVTTYTRPRRMIVVGAVHIAQLLAPMATAVGFEVTVIDSRPAFATPERLPGVTVIHERTERCIQRLSLDSRTALVLLAHDPILDDPALHAALLSPAYYIGCLGSKHTHAKRVERLREAGFSEDAIKRLHAPVGLDIGGRSSGEVAVSILAEIIAVGNRRDPEEVLRGEEMRSQVSSAS